MWHDLTGNEKALAKQLIRVSCTECRAGMESVLFDRQHHVGVKDWRKQGARCGAYAIRAHLDYWGKVNEE